ncbi:MAG: hypothetical protein LC749_09735 [Actinobacteria bacterium]|nr:hypothetical protein [Actinomycetota bacterium]
MSKGPVESISSSTVRRWLHAAAIKPWRYRSWIFPRDPDFAAKAARVLNLYGRVFEGVALGPDAYVIFADEKLRRHRETGFNDSKHAACATGVRSGIRLRDGTPRT